jgi:hypothetical protein
LTVSAETRSGYQINRLAPVVGSSEINVAATPEVAWDVLTAIGRWPSWNPAVTAVSFEGKVGPGAAFRWKAGPGTITSTIQEVEPLHRIAWTGSSFGIRAIHVHTLEPRDAGTFVRTEESYDGVVARLLRVRLQKVLDSALEAELQHLKVEAERRERSE